MYPTRYPRGITVALLCALLLQNCQAQLTAVHEETPSKESPKPEMCPPASSSFLTTAASTQAALPSSTSHLPARATHATSNTPTPTFFRIFTAASGERVSFRKVEGKWQAVLQAALHTDTPQRILPVASASAIGPQLERLQRQDTRTSRARIHILNRSHPPYTPCVYLVDP